MFIRFGVMMIGIIYTLLGLIGFIPGINPVPAGGIGVPYLFNLVAINAVHNLIHLAIGITGIAAASSLVRAQFWGKVIGPTLLFVFAAGMAQAFMEGFPREQWLLGIVPLNSPGHMLHLSTGVVALYLGLTKAVLLKSQ